jgi:thiamine biosynthesis lipoprotein
MTIPAPGLAGTAAWQPVLTGDQAVAVAERDALGTSTRLAIWPPRNLRIACTVVDGVLAELDEQASRFRADSQLSWLHRAGGGLFLLGDGLAEVLGVALAAARWTGGLADPTVGGALIALGYDRDFAAIDPDGGDTPALSAPAPGWQRVGLEGRLLRLPPAIRLDLGATAKGVGCDRAVRAVMSAVGHVGGILISLGGDIAVGGTPPRGGWPVTVADQPDEAGSAGAQLVRLTDGAVATSSVTCRRWRRGDMVLHHIIDPATGFPAEGPWRTASVSAVTCADANAAATAVMVAGPRAESWLAGTGFPGRLVGHDGQVVRVGGWPAASGRPLPTTSVSHVYAGVGPPGGVR